MQFEESSKMHVCGFCGKTFATKKKLENHTLYHEIDPTSCEVCLIVLCVGRLNNYEINAFSSVFHLFLTKCVVAFILLDSFRVNL